MDISLLMTAFLSGLSVFLLTLFIFALLYSRKVRQKRNCGPGDDWIFSDWSTNLYDAFTTKDPADIGHMVGLNADAYLHNCGILKVTPNLKDVVVKKILGFAILLLSGVMGVVFANVLLIVIGLIIGIPLVFFEVQKIEKKTRLKKFQMLEELPRFIDLLQTALQINLPVEEAILITAQSLSDTVLAQELLASIADTQLGIYDWQAAMEKMAQKYEIDALSDFTLDLVTAYNKGVPVLDAVARKGRDIKQSNLLSMKERASKLTSTILLPVLGFKVVPLLALLCIPIIQQISSGL